MSEFSTLAERCEAATGRDTRLNAEIEVAFRGFPEKAYQQRNAMRGRGEPILDRMAFVEAWGPSDFTGSLDAAMTLVPEGLRLMLCEWDDEEHLRALGPWQAVLSKPGLDASFDAMRGYRCNHAAAAALALCAAALRARAQSDLVRPDGDSDLGGDHHD